MLAIITGIEHRKGLDLLASFAYTLDSVGNRKSKTGGLAAVPAVESYSYDAVDQIIEAKYGTARTVAYTYDAAGNRQNVTDNGSAKTYAVNALNQYTREGGSVVSHGENGNLTRRPGASYGYDAQNRLTQAAVGGIVTTFAYDPRNRVVKRTVNGVTTNLTYDGWNLIEERDGAGALQQVYVQGAGVDEMLAKVTTTGAVYYHADGLGSTVALTDESGTLVESYTYDVFGAATIRNTSGLSLPVSGFANRFLFTGREWISEAAIYDYRNRVYSPSLGRFLQADPIRFSAGDVNIYRYCGNSAANFVDPLGLWSLNDCAAEFSKLGSDFSFTPPPPNQPPPPPTPPKTPKIPLPPGGSSNDGQQSVFPPPKNPGSGGGGNGGGGGVDLMALLYALSDFSAGMGDILTLNATNSLREAWGINDTVDHSSASYHAGEIAGAAVAAADIAANGIAIAGYETRIALHEAHHTFGEAGKLAHLQMNVWKPGVKGSGQAFRIPLPWR